MHVGLFLRDILSVNKRCLSNVTWYLQLHNCHSAKQYHNRLTFAITSSAPRLILRYSAIPQQGSIIFRNTVASTLVYSNQTCRSFHMTSHVMEPKAGIRSKRKNGPAATSDRPAKQLKPGVSTISDDDGDLENGTLYGINSDDEQTHLLPLPAATADTAEWQATIEKVVRRVVSVHFSQANSFDTDPAISSEATGFVVDSERGYILTNRVRDNRIKHYGWFTDSSLACCLCWSLLGLLHI